MKEHFHRLNDVVIPSDEFVAEHTKLLDTLKSGDPKKLEAEAHEQSGELLRHLSGGGIAEDKRYINAKTPWTLAHLEERILKSFYNNPAVPPSMKKKLKMALMIKPTLKKKLKGGLKGVSKASGFIRRLMWENSNKHEGAYGNPTWALAPGSKMKKAVKFDYRKLASADQGGIPTYKNKSGTKERNPYGASPFIEHHFSTQDRKEKAPSKPETEAQKKARLEFMAKRLLKHAKTLMEKAKTPEEAKEAIQDAIPEALKSHFANMGEPPVGLEVRPVEPEPTEDGSDRVKETAKAPTASKKPVKSSEGWVEALASMTGELEEDIESFVAKFEESHSLSDKEQKILTHLTENPTDKLGAVIAHLKEEGLTKGLAPGTVSPILKEMRELLKDAVEAHLDKKAKAEDLERRGSKMKEVLKKNIPLRRLRKKAKETLEELRFEKEEREEEKRIEERKKERERRKAEEEEDRKRAKVEEAELAEKARKMEEEAFKETRNIAKSKLDKNLPPKAQMEKWQELWAKLKGRELDSWEKDYWFGDVLNFWYHSGRFPGKSKKPEEEKGMEEPTPKYEKVPGEVDKYGKPLKRLTAKSQQEMDKWKAYLKEADMKYIKRKSDIEEIAYEFVKWLFQKALPLYGYKVVERVFPQEGDELVNDRYAEPKKYNFLVLDGEKGEKGFAWLLEHALMARSKKTDLYEQLAYYLLNELVSGNTKFLFGEVWYINPEGSWSQLSRDEAYGKDSKGRTVRPGTVMLGNNPRDRDDEPTIRWALPQGMAQIIRPLWEELMDYKPGQGGSKKPQSITGSFPMMRGE